MTHVHCSMCVVAVTLYMYTCLPSVQSITVLYTYINRRYINLSVLKPRYICICYHAIVSCSRAWHIDTASHHIIILYSILYNFMLAQEEGYMNGKTFGDYNLIHKLCSLVMYSFWCQRYCNLFINTKCCAIVK